MPRHRYTSPFRCDYEGDRSYSFTSHSLDDAIASAKAVHLDAVISVQSSYRLDGLLYAIYASVPVGKMRGKTRKEIYEMFDAGLDEGIQETISRHAERQQWGKECGGAGRVSNG